MQTHQLFSNSFFFICMDSFPLLNLVHQYPSPFSLKNINKRPIKCSSHNNKYFYYRPFSILLPIIKKIESFASKTSKNPFLVTIFQDYRNNGSWKSDVLYKNGTFAMAVSSAKVKISPIVATLAANPTFVSGLFAWVVAQSLKVFLNFCVEKKWDFRIICASGGMPSSHSALCAALTTSVAICHGMADSLFPVCFWFSLIVMYDAIGVRRHAGMQAETITC
ncbi:hypothetical protein Leryth_021627 [Lithospermum erythrorhizon]|nr:hypothetical protein Leryth_021627 [Lithospermum erythrorhizon]